MKREFNMYPPKLFEEKVSDVTIHKQQQIRYIYSVSMRICNHIFNKGYRWLDKSYHIFDINASSGRYSDKDGTVVIKGSPLIALKQALAEGVQSLRAIFIEKDSEKCEELKEAIRKEFGSKLKGYHIDIRCGDHNEILKEYYAFSKARNGVLYHDPYGEVSWDLLAQTSIVRSFQRIDFIINIPTTTEKRCRIAFGNRSNLMENLFRINKKIWMIREAETAHKWSILVGTNWDGMTPWKKFGFYDIRSEDGKRILKDLTFTETERKNKL